MYKYGKYILVKKFVKSFVFHALLIMHNYARK